jgi:NADH-quinone oxidoreductase subunit K
MFFDSSWLFFSSLNIFLIGAFGLILNKRNLIVLLMSLELMLLGVNLNFIFFSVLCDDFIGQIFAIFILTIAAAESGIGLAIFSIYFSNKQTIGLEGFIRARG